jgi:hypothetical protein
VALPGLLIRKPREQIHSAPGVVHPSKWACHSDSFYRTHMVSPFLKALLMATHTANRVATLPAATDEIKMRPTLQKPPKE